MDKQNRKLSPMEFLAHLKAGGKGGKPLSRRPAGAHGEESRDQAASTAAAPVDGSAGAGQSATAVADPPLDPSSSGASRNGAASHAAEGESGNPQPAPGQLNELFERVNELLGAPGHKE